MAKELRSGGFQARFAATLDALLEKEGEGFGQIEFAARVTQRSGLEIKQPRVSSLKNGRADPSLAEVEALAAGLGVSAGWLAYGEGEVPQLRPKPSRETPVNRKRVPAPRSDDLPAVASARRGRGGSK